MPSIILTRTPEDNARVAPLYRQRGFEVFGVPLIELLDIDLTPKELADLAHVEGTAVLITSRHAALRWLDLRFSALNGSIPQAYYVVGESTARMLEERDPLVPVRLMARSSVELAMKMPKDVGDILYPCSSAHLDEALMLLKNRGARINELTLYSPGIPPQAGDMLARAFREADDRLVIAFFSPSAVDSFFSLRPDYPARAIFAAIGATTADALHGHGIQAVVAPSSPTAEAMAIEVSRSVFRQA